MVGYSLGARVALQLACDHPCAAAAVVAVSGSPGLQSPEHRAARRASDANTAVALRNMDVREFVEAWYAAPLWAPLRRHPRFAALVEQRCGASADEAHALADVIEHCSPGRQNVWPQLRAGAVAARVSLVVGALDAKFVGLAAGIAGVQPPDGGAPAEHGWRLWPGNSDFRVAQVEEAGHAVHVEQPLALASALACLVESH